MNYEDAVKTILNFGDTTGFKSHTQIIWAFEERYEESKSEINQAIETLLNTQFSLTSEEVEMLNNDAINRNDASTISREKDLDAAIKVLSDMPSHSVEFKGVFEERVAILIEKWEAFAKTITRTYDLARKGQAKKEADKIFKCAEFLGAKKLTGTVKQQAWGERIRADYLCDISEEKARKILSNSKYDKASFWIENRAKFQELAAKRDYSKITKWYV